MKYLNERIYQSIFEDNKKILFDDYKILAGFGDSTSSCNTPGKPTTI